jgi:hypothetical protein
MQVSGPLRRTKARPGSDIKGDPGGGDCPVDLFRAGKRHFANGFFACRIDDGNAPGTVGLTPLTADEEAGPNDWRNLV